MVSCLSLKFLGIKSSSNIKEESFHSPLTNPSDVSVRGELSFLSCEPARIKSIQKRLRLTA